MCKKIWITVLMLVLGLGVSNGFAADEKMGDKMMDKSGTMMKDGNKEMMKKGDKMMDKSGMKMDDAKMQEMMKMGAPGENHKQLEPLVGTWNHTSKGWMSPDAPAEESKGKSINSWILDGRFLKQEFKGEAMGKPFEGLAFTGYDNLKGEYNSVWMDSMATSMMTSSSQFNPATKTFSEQGSFSCPMTGEKNRWFRAVTKLIDNDHYTYEMFFKGPDGKEFKSMEISYERAK